MFAFFANYVKLSLMLKVRLQRIGRKNNPAFRVVLTDSKNSTKSGRFLEILGTYNPKAKEDNLKRSLIADRIKYWISKGAKCSDTMHNFLVHDKVIEGKKVNVLPKKKPTLKRKELKAKK
ncbi:MAG: small subunit ribosomal protein S16 [Parcubacteria group bacterium Gr01-1014_24]|nr:MAG: small subunit ribosomal protein S16 [Parcubacteria group bacterium Gr01-1014_24]